MSRRFVVALNVLKGWLLLAVPTALFALLGWKIGGYRIAILFGGSIVLLATALYAYADRIVMGMLGARELLAGGGAGAPFDGRAARRPRRGREAAALRARRRLPAGVLVGARSRRRLRARALRRHLGVASPAELEGVLAHELAHLRHRDVLLQSVVVILAMATVESSRIGGFLQRPLLFVLGPIAAALVHLMLSPKRELLADRLAADLCDSPHGLADALVRLEQAMSLVGFEASPATEPLYTTNPFALEGLAALFDSHPPVGERVRRLRELDPDWRAKLNAA